MGKRTLGKRSRVKAQRRQAPISRHSKQPHQAVRRTESTIEVEAGPLPPAADMAKYEKVLPGSADRIIRMAERQQEHSHEYSLMALRHQATFESRGQWFAGVVLALLVAGGTYLLSTGRFGSALFMTIPVPLWLLLSVLLRWTRRKPPRQ